MFSGVRDFGGLAAVEMEDLGGVEPGFGAQVGGLLGGGALEGAGQGRTVEDLEVELVVGERAGCGCSGR
ncbi:MAG: hypothetical protein ACRDRX_04825 [Pseudonocardiaceae bacterium]